MPDDLSEISWPTRVLIYRDAFLLALADGTSSPIEEDRLGELATKLRLPARTTETLRGWVLDYGDLLERLHDLLEAEPEL